MTLLQVVGNLDSFDEDSTIYAAEPWTNRSQAIVAAEADGGDLPDEARQLGLKYFLEVFIAREFLEGWISTLDTKATVDGMTARLIEYASKDA